MDPHDALQYIVNSTKQINVLRAIQEQPSTVRKGELVSEDGPSRSTVDRAIDELTDRNWVEEKSRNRYDITTTGEAILDGHDSYCATIEEAQTKSELINRVGNYEDAPSIEVFAEATTVKYPSNDPMKGWKRASDEVTKQIEQGVGTYRGMNPIVSTTGNEIGRKILEAADEAELIIDEEVLDASEANYSDALDKGLMAENLDIYVSPQKVTITLAIYNEQRIEASFHSADGHPIGGIRGSDEKLANWATDLYERYRKQAYPLSELLQTSE